MANIYVLGAHDDDAVLGPGGNIVRHINHGDEVFVVIFTTGHTSHQVVLDITSNPSPAEVAKKRREEILKAMVYLGVPTGNLYFFDIPTREVFNHMDEAEMKLRMIFSEIKPDIVYSHYPDAHSDHKAVSALTEKVLGSVPVCKVYQFMIWNRELAAGRPEMNPNDIPEIPENAMVVNLSEQERLRKCNAIYEMRSQVSTRPYPEWQIQQRAILGPSFIRYFLRGQEIFVPYEIPRVKEKAVPLEDVLSERARA